MKERWNRFIDRLIYEGDKKSPDTYSKGKFFIVSVTVFLLLNILFTPYFLITAPFLNAEVLFGTLLSFIPLLSIFIVYPKFGYRILLVNIFCFFGCVGSNYSAFVGTGGVFAPDTAFGIVICVYIFLVGNRASGLFWSAVQILIILYFYFADQQGAHDFRADTMKLPSSYYALTYSFSIIFAVILTVLHDISKEKYLKEVKQAKLEIEQKSKTLEAQKEDIISSINYAKRIQYAVLPHEENIYRSIPLSFIYYKPKDIVSGDFFWFHEIDKDNYIIVCADCTGHGVPGAFMTVIGSSLLNQIVIDNKITQPSLILNELDKLINMTLKQEKEHEHYVQDGMDLSLLRVNKSTKEFIFTSAKRPAVLIRDKQLQEFKGSKFTLGGMLSGEKKFEEIRMNYKEDDILYMFTDGFPDQFGGPKGKKYSTKQLRETLLSIHKLQMNDQKGKLGEAFDKWKSELEQVDDVLVMGVKF